MKNSGIEWIGEIPDSWRVGKLKNHLISYKSGGTPDSSNEEYYTDIGTPWVVIADMTANDYIKDTTKHITDKAIKDKGLEILPKGTILYAMYASVGKVAELAVNATVNQAILGLNFDDEVERQYIKYFLSSWESYIKSESNGTTQFNLNAYKVVNLASIYPSIKEQQRIAKHLDEKCGKIDELIANQQGQIEKLKEYKQSVITEAVTKGLDKSAPMKDSNLSWIIGKVPAHWAVVNPKALFSLRRERAKEGERQLTASQQYGVIYQDDYMRLTGSRIVVVMKDFDILKHVEKGDFVISMRSFQGGLEYSENEGSISSAYVMLKPNREYVVDHFYKWLFKSSLYINALQSTSDLIRDGQAMRYSNFTQLWLYQIPLKEQEQIASYLDKKCADIDKLIAIKQEKIEKLQEYKKSLIYEYVTGKKEVV